MLKNMVYAALFASSVCQVQAVNLGHPQATQSIQSSAIRSNTLATQSAEYNIAKGLAPTLKSQQMSVLEPFAGEFRILGSKEYHQDEQAKFSPIDYAVTRGMFTEPEIARQISINQYDRFLNWKMARPPISPQLATQLVNNMHIIPGNPAIAEEIKKVKRGDLVRLQGDLVQINDKDLVWKSALDWKGIGDGACRLIRVDSIQWIERQNI